MKRKRDDKGKFVTHVPGPESINIISRELVDPILELAEKDVSPTAADLDRHQANVEAENQARMDTERKQMYPERVGGVSPGDTVPTFPVPGSYPIEVDEDSIPPQPSVPYGGIALFSASLAILAILGTLWAVYYVLRPKLDNFKINVTVPSNFHSGDVATCVPGSSAWSPVGAPNPKGNIQSEHSGIGEIPSSGPFIFNQSLNITAKEDVWLKISVDGHETVTGVVFSKGAQIGYEVNPDSVFLIRAGKPNAISLDVSGKEFTPKNKYHGGGNLAEYVLDGKELLAGK